MTDLEQALLAAGINVSRETYKSLRLYTELIAKWNPVINLVSKASLPDLWMRHIIDSAQLYAHLPKTAEHSLDIGSGGGLPGIVLAILSLEDFSARKFTLVESDQRKAAFLREAARVIGLNIEIHAGRVEGMDPVGADVVTARALAPLTKLIGIASRHLDPRGVCLFPKGETHQQEIDEALKHFCFNCIIIPSKTDRKCAILKVDGIRNV